MPEPGPGLTPESVLDAASEGICVLDETGRVVFANPAAAGLLGWSMDDLIGRTLHERAMHQDADGRAGWRSRTQPSRPCSGTASHAASRARSSGARRTRRCWSTTGSRRCSPPARSPARSWCSATPACGPTPTSSAAACSTTAWSAWSPSASTAATSRSTRPSATCSASPRRTWSVAASATPPTRTTSTRATRSATGWCRVRCRPTGRRSATCARDGDIVHVVLHATLVRAGEAPYEPLYFFVQILDVTEQRTADEALRQDAERTARIVELCDLLAEGTHEDRELMTDVAQAVARIVGDAATLWVSEDARPARGEQLAPGPRGQGDARPALRRPTTAWPRPRIEGTDGLHRRPRPRTGYAEASASDVRRRSLTSSRSAASSWSRCGCAAAPSERWPAPATAPRRRTPARTSRWSRTSASGWRWPSTTRGCSRSP